VSNSNCGCNYWGRCFTDEIVIFSRVQNCQRREKRAVVHCLLHNLIKLTSMGFYKCSCTGQEVLKSCSAPKAAQTVKSESPESSPSVSARLPMGGLLHAAPPALAGSPAQESARKETENMKWATYTLPNAPVERIPPRLGSIRGGHRLPWYRPPHAPSLQPFSLAFCNQIRIGGTFGRNWRP